MCNAEIDEQLLFLSKELNRIYTDRTFVSLILQDFKYFRSVKSHKRCVLMFPPLDNFHRKLIHTLAKEFEFTTFSVPVSASEYKAVVCYCLKWFNTAQSISLQIKKQQSKFLASSHVQKSVMETPDVSKGAIPKRPRTTRQRPDAPHYVPPHKRHSTRNMLLLPMMDTIIDNRKDIKQKHSKQTTETNIMKIKKKIKAQKLPALPKETNDGFANDGFANDGFGNDGFANDGFANDGLKIEAASIPIDVFGENVDVEAAVALVPDYIQTPANVVPKQLLNSTMIKNSLNSNKSDIVAPIIKPAVKKVNSEVIHTNGGTVSGKNISYINISDLGANVHTGTAPKNKAPECFTVDTPKNDSVNKKATAAMDMDTDLINVDLQEKVPKMKNANDESNAAGTSGVNEYTMNQMIYQMLKVVNLNEATDDKPMEGCSTSTGTYTIKPQQVVELPKTSSSNKVQFEFERSEISQNKAVMLKNEKNLSDEQAEMNRAYVNINRKSRPIIKHSVKSDVLIIDENVPTTSMAANIMHFEEEQENLTSWEDLFDQCGELKVDYYQEIKNVVGDPVEVQRAKQDYNEYQRRDLCGLIKDMTHVIELYDFPAAFTTPDLISVYKDYEENGLYIKWVDDTHALLVLASPWQADKALKEHHPMLKSRPLVEASAVSIICLKRLHKNLLPPSKRPPTCPDVAKRMVTGALGIKSITTREDRKNELKLIKDAKEKKRLVIQQQDDAWEGRTPHNSTK